MTGETSVFRIRDYAGSWMRLGYIGERSRSLRDTAKGQQLPPSNLFVLHFDGLLTPEDLLGLAERLREAANARLAEKAGQRTLFEEAAGG